ncbi:D-alanine--poly(phosphoribitol) ligase subunit 2 [Fusobacterium nucleatum]|uniref:D-alanine--poly(phosphoribitol) ligase subunit DltC n=1 Tax=Fusobacterium nucleatum TaxID=851 RepID=UPI00195BEFF1|nr:D-alanine--poly(phosphoribitol) ligase subunit DltC [Fusobacterium nucleatum]VTX65231.1 D-alanine--poly(phosphoribitol) ligase subunit 2 [Fusobacterium nucleatum]
MVDKNRILDIIEEISEDDSFREDLDADLLDLGILDSLGMVTLIISLEKNFSIKLPITEINVEDVNTPNKIIKLVEGKVNNG